MKRASVLVLLSLLIALPTHAEGAQAPDKMLDAMMQELKRNMGQLKFQDYPAPYFISYLMRDVSGYACLARFGTAVKVNKESSRALFADVRVGSQELDNTEDPYPGMDLDYSDPMYLSMGPLGDNELALRKTLWMLTDREYKKSVASFLKVKAKGIYEAQQADFAGSFSPAPVVERMEKALKLPPKLDTYAEQVGRLSEQIAANKKVFDSVVSFDAALSHRYYVNSEGTRYFVSEMLFNVSIEVFARAEDGTVLPHSLVYYGRTLEQLPSFKEMNRDVARMLQELEALTTAPVMQPFSGPTLLEGDTAGVFLHEALGHRLEGHRQQGRDEGGTFRGKVGDVIMPEHLTIVDDPSVKEFEGEGLNGHYTIDDEGVVAQVARLVEKGKLVGFMLTRRPMDTFKSSNGHARASWTARPVARMGNLIMTSTKSLSSDQLKQRLMELAREQGKPYGIIVRRAASGSTNTSSWGFQAFKGLARLVYQVDANTGEETLVRGVELVGTPLSSLMRIDSVSDKSHVFNGVCGAESGWVPVSTVSPSLLLRELEFQKSPPRRENPEILPPPSVD